MSKKKKKKKKSDLPEFEFLLFFGQGRWGEPLLESEYWLEMEPASRAPRTPRSADNYLRKLQKEMLNRGGKRMSKVPDIDAEMQRIAWKMAFKPHGEEPRRWRWRQIEVAWEEGSFEWDMARNLLKNTQYRHDFGELARLLKTKFWPRLQRESRNPSALVTWEDDSRMRRENAPFIGAVREFSHKYPILFGVWGWLPLIDTGAKVTRLFYICKKCLSVRYIPDDPEDSALVEQERCCNDPDLESYYEIVLRNVRISRLTLDRMRYYLREIKFGRVSEQERAGTPQRILKRGEKAGEEERKERERKKQAYKEEIRKVGERILLYADEFNKWFKNAGHSSTTIQEMKENNIGRDLTPTKAVDTKIEVELEEINSRYKHVGRKVTSADTVRKSYTPSR